MENGDEFEYSVLSVYPSPRGFGFAVLDSERGLVDWGIVRVSSARRSDEVSARLEGLLDWHNPSVIAVENTADTFRGSAAKELTQRVISRAFDRGIRVIPISQKNLREFFSDSDRHAIATQIVERLPELAPRLPGKRRPWESVDERAYLFAAVALALVSISASPDGR